jgi:hypothetical protein
MKIEELSLLLTAVQTLIIVLSFIGVIWQLRQFNQNMRYDAYSKAVEDYSRISEVLIDKPYLNKIFYSSNADFNKLDDIQKDFYNYLALTFGFLERIYLLFKKGWINQKTWDSWERWLTQGWFHLDLFEIFWKNERENFNVDFYKYVDKKYKEHGQCVV